MVLSMRAECTQNKGAQRGSHPGRRGCKPAERQDAKGRMNAPQKSLTQSRLLMDDKHGNGTNNEDRFVESEDV